MRHHSRLFPLLVLWALSVLMTSCASTQKHTLILATTTSTEQTGLLGELLPLFTEETGIDVAVIAVGTGQALALGREGEADLLLVHDLASEERFIREGHAAHRHDVMYNRFLLVGPKDDPLNIKSLPPESITEAFERLGKGHALFVSRGDNSGTHQRELSLWEATALTPKGDWHLSAGKGMGEVLQMADELNAYTLTDEGTWLTMAGKLDLIVVGAGDPRLHNSYGILAVNRPEGESDRRQASERFIQWLLSEAIQQRIGEFGRDTCGQSLFVPNAKQ